MTLDEATSKLEAISLNPCHCNVCVHAAKLARDTLMEVSPLGEKLLQTPERDSDEFRDLEKRFREEELAIMENALDHIVRGRCMMQQSPLAPPPPQIPSLPYQQGLSDAIERYRRYTMQRKPRGEYKRNPRIPGTYVLK